MTAAIAGNYAEFKLVKTRGVFAITIEFAVERTAEVFAALGYPQPGVEIPVAVARLNTPPSSQTLGAGAQRSSAVLDRAVTNPVAPEGDENRGARAVKRAGILCKDPEFQRFFGQTEPFITLHPDWAETQTAAMLRTRCQIASRRDLAHDARAREAFRALVTEFDLWRGRIAEVRG